MDSKLEKDCSALGGLFQAIINDMRRSSPIWEDFTNKATKLNSSLKTTQIAISAFLDTFQKVADMATGSRGATREMGSSLTRLCMRHRSIENKIKTLASTITENLVAPLQEKMEEWKRNVAHLDKEHAKEYKKASQEIKKCAADTIRLQKKVKKGKSDIQSRLESALQDVNDKYLVLEETEKNAVRTALIEERSRFCMFVTCFKPFVEWEISLLTEITHLKEVMDNLSKQSSDPHTLPAASEQVILDVKGADSNVWAFQTTKNLTPPSSPSSLGSRKSSMCSNSSINSSSDSSAKSYSPTHHHYRFRSPSQVSSVSLCSKQSVQQLPLPGSVRLTSVSSQDSGFTSQDALFLRSTTPPFLHLRQEKTEDISEENLTAEQSSQIRKKKQVTTTDSASTGVDNRGIDSNASTPSENPPSTSSTWNNWPSTPHVQNSDPPRPHTISSAYEKTHSRPALSDQVFVAPSSSRDMLDQIVQSHDPAQTQQVSPYGHIRAERPKSAIGGATSRPTSATIIKMQPVMPPLGPKPKSKAVPPPTIPAISQDRLMSFLFQGGQQPTYVNMTDLAHMAAEKQRKQEQRKEQRESKLMSKSQTQSPCEQKDSKEQKSQSLLDLLDIQEAIRDLENCTAALHSDYDDDTDSDSVTSQKGSNQAQQNSLELAIKELEATTAALTSHYEEPTTNAVTTTSRTSLQCSSGYGTMNSTPAGSEDTIASGDLDLTPTEGSCDCDKYFTIPRNNSDMVSAYKAEVVNKRPASTAGLPVSKPPASGSSRRTSGSKPPPPVRRSSSVSTGSVGLPPVLHKLRSSPSKQGLPASGPQAQQQQPAPQQMAPPQQSPISHQTLLRHPKPPIPTQQQPPPLSPASPKSVKLSQPDHSMQHSPGTKHRRHLSGTDSPPNPMILRDGDSGIITGGLGIHLSSARTSNNKVVVEYAVPEVSKPLKAPITATKSAASSSVSATPTAEGSPHASVRRSSVIDTYSSNYAALRSERRGDKPTQKEDGGGGEDDVDRGFPLPPPPTEEELAAMGVLPHPCNAPMTSVLSEMKSAQRLRRLSTDSSEC
ncbi:protein MTSS 1 isoform X7 [Octopus sinensis]|uniref:Protein MTSS 1 isoform X7 n=1 Tax=Octopus sinensis TaxID=2607531 RepID=A0A7E6F740_9MOLL|nr:protein MTSS 1 isoform X7 [Octopus sinensis]